MAGDFPPSSRTTGTRLSAAVRPTQRPIAAEPVKSSLSKARPVMAAASSASPSTATTRSGSRCRTTAAQIAEAVRGTCSDGFSTTRHPAASAPTTGDRASCTG